MKLIRVSERDVSSLEKLRELSAPSCFAQPATYRDVVVIKPWGYEFLIFQNEQVAAWFLHVKQGHATSMHCHPNKKTALIVLSGQALCNTFYNRNYLGAIDSVVIEKGVFHTTRAVSSEGVDLIEIETPPDKTDLVRLDDMYGRKDSGYEGLSDMRTDLEQFGHFYFQDPQNETQVRQGVEISLFSCNGDTDLSAAISASKGVFYCPFEGRIEDESGEVVLDVGDSAEAPYLGAYGKLRLPVSSMLLKVRRV